MLKSLKLCLTISVTLILFICYFTKGVHDGELRRHSISILNKFLLKTAVHCLHFYSLLLSFLFIVLCLLLVVLSPDVEPVLFAVD